MALTNIFGITQYIPVQDDIIEKTNNAGVSTNVREYTKILYCVYSLYRKTDSFIEK